MNHPAEIAIIEPNTLTALGLRTILEELLPRSDHTRFCFVQRAD